MPSNHLDAYIAQLGLRPEEMGEGERELIANSLGFGFFSLHAEAEAIANLFPMRYALTTLTHKFYVALACLQLRVPLWRVLVHDLSKFGPAELPHYQRQFYGAKDDPAGFARAWLHHQNANPHHWEYWILRSDHSKGASGAVNGCLEMPETYVREMVADWMGASKAYTGSWYMAKWLAANLPKMKLHPRTRAKVGEILEEIGYEDNFK